MSNFAEFRKVKGLTHAEKDDGEGNPYHRNDVLHIVSYIIR